MIPKTYKNTLSEIEFMTGLSANELGDDMYLLCHWQFPDKKIVYIAIKMIDKYENQYYDLYEYNNPISYTNITNQYGQPIGLANIHNEEEIIKVAVECKNISATHKM